MHILLLLQPSVVFISPRMHRHILRSNCSRCSYCVLLSIDVWKTYVTLGLMIVRYILKMFFWIEIWIVWVFSSFRLFGFSLPIFTLFSWSSCPSSLRESPKNGKFSTLCGYFKISFVIFFHPHNHIFCVLFIDV